MKKNRIAILGAGLTGLSVAYHLEKKGINYSLFEKEPRVGGLCRSCEIKGFIFDFAEHFLRIPNNYVRRILNEVLPGKLYPQKLNSSIYLYGTKLKYPLQENLFGLSPEIIKECLIGFVQAYYSKKKKEKNLEQWLKKTSGEGLYRHFLLPYNRKSWNTEPKQLSFDWLFNERIIPVCSLDKIFEGALYPPEMRTPEESIRWYPRQGGVETIPQAFLTKIRNTQLNKEVLNIDLSKRKLFFSGREYFDYDILISTIPLINLRYILMNLSDSLRQALNNLNYNSMICVNLGINKTNLTKEHWIYFSEPRYPFIRIYFPMNFSPELVPKGKSSVSAIITYSRHKPINQRFIVEKTIRALEDLKILKKEEIILKNIMTIKYAYPIPDLNRNRNVNFIQKFLKKNDFYSIGRYGNWEYAGMEHAIMTGKEIAEMF